MALRATMRNNQATAPRYVDGAAQALNSLEKLTDLSLPITRDDDWALTRAIHSLREIVEANVPHPETSQ